MTAAMESSLHLPLRDVLARMQARIMSRSTYFGITTFKSPTDFWVYQELLFETRPDFIIEIGNFHGGSTLALAHLCDALGHGQVIGVDLTHEAVPEIVRRHARIRLIEGDGCASFPAVAELAAGSSSVMVIEDSAHTFDNTLSVLRTYAPLVTPDGYLIVEDGIIHHGLEGGPSPGPYEAIEAFVQENNGFEIDRSRESFLITWNPKGYLKRVRP
ncbi:MAG TPA: CmcI family methyltransferase [Thermoanaerobaculia bacterium]|nr:CmcI family methyltransferase [Thermoanaerobaculia bacterium]